MLALLGSALLSATSPDAGEAAWLEWNAPPQCPGSAALETSIAERLGRDVTPGEIEVRAHVEDAGASGYRLSLSTRTDAAEDRRELTAHDCRALADATALLVALTIDAVAVAQHVEAPQPEPEPEQEPAPPVVREPEPREVPAPEPGPVANPRSRGESPARPRPEIAGAIAGGGIIGTLPGVSGGPELAIALLWPRLRLEIAGSWFAPRTEPGDDASVEVQLGVATARACARVGTPRLEAPMCGGIELGASRGDGDGAPAARTAHGLWLAPVVGAGLHGWVTPRLALLARIDVAIPLAHPAFELTGPTGSDRIELYRASPVSGRLWLGLEVKFSRPRDGSTGGRRRPG